MSAKSFNPAKVLANLRGANKEAQGRYLGDMRQREGAARILSPTEVSGDYDAGRLLSTTLGGHERIITAADLQAFKRNAQTLGKKFRGGITAKTIVDMSLKVDRDRANAEIRAAVPLQQIGGRLHFITNAGPKSEVTRHHVHVELLNYSAAVSSPAKNEDLVKMLATGPLKFDCDCGRHTYWYRYIATIGHFNAGRDETGFPKIRNPRLVGVACKHVLRVMQQLGSPSVRGQIAKMIDSGRTSVERKLKVLSKKDAQAIVEQQSAQSDWKRNRIESTAERQARLSQQRMIQAAVKRPKPKAAPTSRSIEVAKRRFAESAKKLAAIGEMTPRQLSAVLAKLK